jgi:hypothetical protein
MVYVNVTPWSVAPGKGHLSNSIIPAEHVKAGSKNSSRELIRNDESLLSSSQFGNQLKKLKWGVLLR